MFAKVLFLSYLLESTRWKLRRPSSLGTGAHLFEKSGDRLYAVSNDELDAALVVLDNVDDVFGQHIRREMSPQRTDPFQGMFQLAKFHGVARCMLM